MKSMSPIQFALLGPYIAPQTGAKSNAAAAILKFEDYLVFAGWSKAEARIETRRTTSKSAPRGKHINHGRKSS